jgi:hypothetical protein
MSHVMITLGLSDGINGIKSEWIDGILPRGLLMLTLGLAVGIDDGLGKGTYAGEICGSNVKSRRMWLIEDPLQQLLSKSVWITVMAPLTGRDVCPHGEGRICRNGGGCPLKRLKLVWEIVTTEPATKGSGP